MRGFIICLVISQPLARLAGLRYAFPFKVAGVVRKLVGWALAVVVVGGREKDS